MLSRIGSLTRCTIRGYSNMRKHALEIILVALLILLVGLQVRAAGLEFPIHISTADQKIEGHIQVHRVYDEETHALIYVFSGYQKFAVVLYPPKGAESADPAFLPFVAAEEK